jgi:hypothetical protein
MAKNKVGRPTEYKKEFVTSYAELAEKECTLNGADDKKLAEYFGVCEKTINNWKIEHPEFLQSIKKGKREFDTNKVEVKLLEKALGYEHPDVKLFMHEGKVIEHKIIKHYPPDSTAGIFWLKNRRPEDWRDIKAVELEASGPEGGPIPFRAIIDDNDDTE